MERIYGLQIMAFGGLQVATKKSVVHRAKGTALFVYTLYILLSGI